MNNYLPHICFRAIILLTPIISFAQQNAYKIMHYLQDNNVLYYNQIDNIIGGHVYFSVDSLNTNDLIILASHISDNEEVSLISNPESSRIDNIPIGMLYAYMIEKNNHFFFRCTLIMRKDLVPISYRDLLIVKDIYIREILNRSSNLNMVINNYLEGTDYLWGNCY